MPLENPYKAHAHNTISTVLEGGRAYLGGAGVEAQQRLRLYCFYITEQQAGAAQALLAFDIRDTLQELERVNAALSWMEDQDPQLVDKAREKFKISVPRVSSLKGPEQ